ncbi:unnamed protein product [Linum trigynum]|uniref:Secreted protein n=1 Tax=Linum trigynum TaxID=586398 RepID=A0AAV2CSH9_9ROSI
MSTGGGRLWLDYFGVGILPLVLLWLPPARMEHWAVRSCEREYGRWDSIARREWWRPTGESVGLGGKRGGGECGGREMDGGGGLTQPASQVVPAARGETTNRGGRRSVCLCLSRLWKRSPIRSGVTSGQRR